MSKRIAVQCTACKRQRFLAPRDAANIRTFCPECGNIERLANPPPGMHKFIDANGPDE